MFIFLHCIIFPKFVDMCHLPTLNVIFNIFCTRESISGKSKKSVDSQEKHGWSLIIFVNVDPIGV